MIFKFPEDRFKNKNFSYWYWRTIQQYQIEEQGQQARGKSVGLYSAFRRLQRELMQEIADYPEVHSAMIEAKESGVSEEEIGQSLLDTVCEVLIKFVKPIPGFLTGQGKDN